MFERRWKSFLWLEMRRGTFVRGMVKARRWLASVFIDASRWHKSLTLELEQLRLCKQSVSYHSLKTTS